MLWGLRYDNNEVVWTIGRVQRPHQCQRQRQHQDQQDQDFDDDNQEVDVW